jgi:ABC-type nitrate/sulfonate/bicarbonate transport system permease component
MRGQLRLVGSVLAVTVGLLFAWQVAIWVRGIPSYSLPTPLTTLQEMVRRASLLLSRSLSTVEGAAAGLLVSAVIALLMSMLVFQWPILARPVTMYALVIRTLPIVGIAPLVTLIAGRGLATSVLCVVIVTVFTLYVSAVASVQAAPASLGDLAALYRSSFARRVRALHLPSAWAGLLVGFRIAIPLSLMSTILAEWLSGRPGLGSLMVQAQADRDNTLLWATTVTAAGLGMLSFALPSLLSLIAERRGFSATVGDPMR